jgi:putative ABC transport system permease protein
MASVEALPGVDSASVSRGLPIGDWAGQFFTTADRPNPPARQVPDANYIVVGHDYFRTLQIPLLQGRSFNEHDTENSERVVIVNEHLARRYWPGQNPLGKQLRMGAPGSNAPWLSIVGVVGNVRSQGRDESFHAELYVPYQQFPWVLTPEYLMVRTAPNVTPASVGHAVVEALHRVGPKQPVAELKTMDQVAREPLAQQRMMVALLGAFAGLALVLSGLGVYSVLSYSVSQRTREVGVRLALGAERRDVVKLVVRQGFRLTLSGVVIGLFGAIGLTRFLSSLLYGVKSNDSLTFIIVSIILTGVALLACYIPAQRATKVDPMVALRYE